MMFAARKLQGIGLIMLLTIFALVAYPISLRVSATRAELAQVEREIARTRHQNRMLEGDIAVLANARQLDRWNSEFLGYVAPGADQYLQGERALANLDRLRPAPGMDAARPVLVSMQAAVPDRDDGAGGVDADGVGATDSADADTAAGARQVAMVNRRELSASMVRDISRNLAPATTLDGPAQ